MQIIESLTQFIVDLEAFETQLKNSSLTLSACGKVRHSVRGRMHDCGMDIAHFGSTFCDAHTKATAWAVDDIEIFNQTRENWQLRFELLRSKQDSLAARREEEGRRGLTVAYKAILFFIRAFQDSAYAVLVELTGGKAPAYPSMSRCLGKQKNGPSFQVISGIEGYEEWFFRMRDWRNRIKSGVGFGMVGPQSNVGVAFVHITDENSLTFTSDTIHMRDLIEGVRFSSQLLTSIVNLVALETTAAKV
ncbi:hypothetical protein [Massilia sp. 9I]|uniref:hypothetical protein n=1 Tax=Massilia sp. 9I TaxID=2653152 RepID=UPI0012EF9A66|nr:hypothetical protein [Massilia sp. 9I]VXB54602.1 hypothetical protein MASSI9I_21011 [Massilia sp. 9I]